MTGKHHSSSSSCQSSIRVPPIALWNTTQVVAFPNNHANNPKYQSCCGLINQIQLYNHACFQFCNTPDNQTDVVSCIVDGTTDKKASGFNSSQGGQHEGDTEDDSTSSAPVYLMSKSAVGLAVMVGVSILMGTV